MCDHAQEHLSSYMTARDVPHREKIGIRFLEENQISSSWITSIIWTLNRHHSNADNQIQTKSGHASLFFLLFFFRFCYFFTHSFKRYLFGWNKPSTCQTMVQHTPVFLMYFSCYFSYFSSPKQHWIRGGEKQAFIWWFLPGWHQK